MYIDNNLTAGIPLYRDTEARVLKTLVKWRDIVVKTDAMCN